MQLCTTYTAVNDPTLESLSAGADGSARTVAELKTAYDKFNDSETIDLSLIIAGMQVTQHTLTI